MDCQKQSNGDALWDVNSYSPHTFLRIAKIVVWRCEIYGYIYKHLRGAFAWDGYLQIGTPIKTKENDFLVAVVNNPTYSIYDLIMIAGLNSHNTQFLTEQEDAGSKFVRKNYTPTNFHRIYSKLFKAWRLFQKCQNYDLNNEEIKSYMQDYSTWDVNKPNINHASNPQLIRALKVVPLSQ